MSSSSLTPASCDNKSYRCRWCGCDESVKMDTSINFGNEDRDCEGEGVQVQYIELKPLALNRLILSLNLGLGLGLILSLNSR